MNIARTYEMIQIVHTALHYVFPQKIWWTNLFSLKLTFDSLN